MSPRLLVSACLLGHPVRYDGQSNALDDAWLQQWAAQGLALPFCPEVAGGLPTPRVPAQRRYDRIITLNRLDVSAEFRLGAEQALRLCQQHGIRFALLKEGSPSCGVSRIHDGHFRGHKIAGMGLTTEFLRQAGIGVFSEHQLKGLRYALAQAAD
ncbi:MAG: DUF523 domain-containing protein [Aeromonas sp.]